MTPSFALTSSRRPGAASARRWRSPASLAFAFQPSLVLAQVQMSDPDKVPAKPKPPAPAKKAASRKTPTDNVSDDLNRREAERADPAMRAMSSSPAMAAPLAATPALLPADSRAVEAKPVETKSAAESLPPTVAAIPPRAPIVSASLTDLGVGQAPPAAAVTPSGPPPQFVPAPTPSPSPAPAPVPIQPPPVAAPRRRRRW